jgi:recombinational DNA repair protein (RecF pathway)
MAKNRYSTPVDYTPKSEKKEEGVKLVFKPCCVCGKKIDEGYYGRHNLADGDGGTCSKKCELIKEPNHGYSMETHS